MRDPLNEMLGVPARTTKAAISKYIYVEQGAYSIANTIQFEFGDGGLIIEGGWSRTGATFRLQSSHARTLILRTGRRDALDIVWLWRQ